MFNKILVPVDGSDTAFSAVVLARELAALAGSTVTLVYVIDLLAFSGLGGDSVYGQAEYLKAATAEAEGALQRATACLEQANVPTEAVVVQGKPPHQGILHTAAEMQANAIVMGSNGRRGLQKLMLGSVAQKVLAQSAVPVMVAPAPKNPATANTATPATEPSKAAGAA